MSQAKVVLRQVNKGDKDFVMNSWLEGQYWGSQYWQTMKQDVFFREYARVITQLLSTPTAKIEVATFEDEPDSIIGILVYDGPVIYWAYVKKDYRSKGVLNLMLSGKDFEVYTSSTKPGVAVAKKKGLIFNPLIRNIHV